jgi:hypothetical protein
MEVGLCNIPAVFVSVYSPPPPPRKLLDGETNLDENWYVYHGP